MGNICALKNEAHQSRMRLISHREKLVEEDAKHDQLVRELMELEKKDEEDQTKLDA